jgi:site-specific DNA recombinase
MSISEVRRARRHPTPTTEPRALRVAIYARKSTEKGLEQEFNSIDNQIVACRAYIASQGQDWVALPEPYTDPGYSGATLDRPDMGRLLADVEADQIDIVLAYRMDRVSRRQLDMLTVLDLFEQHEVRFISVTEPFTTATPIGRAMISLLGVFAQMERETITERVRDKMRAARRLGRWQGGRPLLGYDVVAKKLVVNEVEADDVRTIFDIYLRTTSLVATMEELTRRGIRNKSWTTLTNRVVQGRVFDANGLRRLLGNVVYAGKLRAGDEVADGEQPAIVPQPTWDAAQGLLADVRTARSRERKPSGALLQGLLRCAGCGGGMVAHYTQKGARRYGAYVCATQKRRGKAACRGSRAPLGGMENFVVGRIRAIGRDPALIAEAVGAAATELVARREELTQDLRRAEAEVRRGQAGATERAADLRAALTALKARTINEADLRAALASFDAIWDALFAAERSRVLHLLLDRVVYDARAETAHITFRQNGLGALANGEEVP